MKYINEKVSYLCPICGGNETVRLYTVSSLTSVEHFLGKDTEDGRKASLKNSIEKLWEKDTAEVIKCLLCDFCFSQPFVSGDKNFYNLAYLTTATYPLNRWEYGKTLDLFGKEGMKDFKFLEIGAGEGEFIKKVIPFTPAGNILSTEYSESGMARIRDYGVTCLGGDIREEIFDKYIGTFNVICMFQVLEHLDGIENVFQRISDLSKGIGSKLFISVPNPLRIEFNELNGALLDTPPNHVGRWNKQCFEQIGLRYGWKLMDYQIELSESAISKIKNFCASRYIYKNNLGVLSGLGLKDLPGIAWECLLSVPKWKELFNAKLGMSSWVCFEKV